MCDQQRLRPTGAYAQSDQSLCLLLRYSMTVKLLAKHYLEFLSLKGDCTSSSESIHVKMPHCWKSHVRTLVECITNYNYFSYFSTKTYVVGTQKNCLNEHPKHMLKLMGKKIFTILRSKILFILTCDMLWLFSFL